MITVKKLFRNKKGIDTILAALLMVVIVVVASVMVYAWSTGLLGGLLVTPPTGKEAINLEQSGFATNNTQATLYLRNAGTASITFVSYYVKDSSGNQWAKLTWTNAPPAVAVNGLSTTVVNIGALSGCTYTGTASAFNTFTVGNSYTVVIVTSRNNQFTFVVVR